MHVGSAILILTLVLGSSVASLSKLKKKVCLPFPHASLTNGQIKTKGHDKFSFTCDSGYLLTSHPLVRCYRGKWTSTKEPRCIKTGNMCEDPEPIENGRILGQERGAGSVIQYMCNPGFILMGEPTRSCINSGHWGGITPTCMDEKEPVKEVAERLRSKFVTEMGSHSNDSKFPQARVLDPDSVMHGLELVILIDRSSSVDPEDFKIGVHFIKFLMQEFGVKNGNNTAGTRVAVLAFGTKVEILFNLDNATITGPVAANKALDTLQAGGGGTAMMEALMDVSTRLSNLRQDAKRAIFMVTDGEPNIESTEDTLQLAKQLRDLEDFEIFTVGIGRGINRRVLSRLASEPLMNHVFVLDKYSDLRQVIEAIREKPSRPKFESPFKCGYVKHSRNYLKLWPWLAALYIGQPDSPKSPHLRFCAGTLICSEWVLTAASCLYHLKEINAVEIMATLITQELFVTLGERSVIHEDRNQMNFYANRVVVHPDFNPLDNLQHNLALIRLNEQAPMRKFRPACLPPTDRPVLLHQDLGVNASIAGWGLSPGASSDGDSTITGGTVQLHSSNSTVMLEEESICEDFNGINSKENIFCAGGIGMQTCIGDVGSPIIAVDPFTGLHHVIGILSRKSECAQGINEYVELSRYTEWISDATDQCSNTHNLT